MKKYKVKYPGLRGFNYGDVICPVNEWQYGLPGAVAGDDAITNDIIERNPGWFEEVIDWEAKCRELESRLEQPQPPEPDAVAVLREVNEAFERLCFSPEGRLKPVYDKIQAVLSGQPIPSEWEEKYNALRIEAIAKNARLISVLKTVIDYANGGYLNDQKKDTLDLCEKAIAEFRLNETTPPLSEQADSRADFKREVDLAERNGLVIANIKLMAERKELAAALNRIVYAYRNAQSTELSRAIFDTDEILSKYV